MSRPEWHALEACLLMLPADVLRAAAVRIEQSAEQERPVVCPFLDREAGACLVYEARPLACRSYGFYVERQRVLGCHRIEEIADREPEIVWGNHAGLEKEMDGLGVAHSLVEWWRESEALQEKRSTLVSPADRDNFCSRS